MAVDLDGRDENKSSTTRAPTAWTANLGMNPLTDFFRQKKREELPKFVRIQ